MSLLKKLMIESTINIIGQEKIINLNVGLSHPKLSDRITSPAIISNIPKTNPFDFGDPEDVVDEYFSILITIKVCTNIHY